MKKTLLMLCFIAHVSITFSQQTEIPPQADTLYNHLMSAARPAVKNWVSGTATKYKGKDITREQAIAEVKQSYNTLGNLNDADIEAIAFLVLMQAAKSAQEDLKSVMGEVKSINNNKAAQRQQAGMLKKSSANINSTVKPEYRVADSLKTSKTNLALKTADLKDKKDNMNDVSSEQQLKMQMTMERRSKMTEAISNLMKKVSETEQSVIQNLK